MPYLISQNNHLKVPAWGKHAGTGTGSYCLGLQNSAARLYKQEGLPLVLYPAIIPAACSCVMVLFAMFNRSFLVFFIIKLFSVTNKRATCLNYVECLSK